MGSQWKGCISGYIPTHAVTLEQKTFCFFEIAQDAGSAGLVKVTPVYS